MRGLTAAAVMMMATSPTWADGLPDLPPGPGTPATLKPVYARGDLGHIDYPGDVDAYRVKLQRGTNYGAIAQSYCHGKTVALYDRNFRLLAKSSPDNPDQDAFVERIARYTGMYYVTVADKPVPVGYTCGDVERPLYIVAVTNNCAPNRATGCKVSLGTTEIRHIWAGRDRAWARFNVTKPGAYTIVGLGRQDGGQWAVPGVLGLRSADGRPLTDNRQNDAHQCADGAACIKATLPVGKYFVTLRMPGLLHDELYQIRITN